MSDEYPKALYRGDTKSYEHVIADGEDNEQHLRKEGYVHYSELKEPEIKNTTDELEEVDLDAFVPVEQFDLLAEKLTETEEKLNEKTIELERAQEQITYIEGQHAKVISNLEGEINSLKEALTEVPAAIGIPQEDYDAVYQEREKLLKENAQYKYSAMSAADLRVVLDGKGIKYGSRDEKPALVKLVLESLYPKEGE
ncbi:hypothetical protein ACSVHR_03105 [Acinetobacter nosocomialis]|uniref:hypothetical protein n=1 Tax=Acinetobacter nosocomialis TaxID=106654 RepID=UPI003F60D467